MNWGNSLAAILGRPSRPAGPVSRWPGGACRTLAPYWPEPGAGGQDEDGGGSQHGRTGELHYQ
jgi:hypothetical protein